LTTWTPLAKRTGPHLWPLIIYLLLTLALTFPLVTHFASAIPGDGFDGWQNYWNLWWMKLSLVDQHRLPFTTNILYHPTGVDLYFHTLNPLNGLLTLPVQLSFGLLPAYNVVVLVSFALGGYGAYLLALQVLRQQAKCRDQDAGAAVPEGGGYEGSPSALTLHLPAFVAGLIYTFAPFHFAHLLGHMQVISLEWIPFFVLYLIKAVAPAAEMESASGCIVGRPAGTALVRRDGLLAALFLVLVGLCDWYYAFYCLLFSLLLLVYLACRRRLRVHNLLTVAGVVLLFGIALSPMLVPMTSEARGSGFMVPDPAQTRTFSADLLAFVTPQEFHPIWGAQGTAWASSFTSTTSERTVFAGFVPLLLAIAGTVSLRRSRFPWYWSLSLAVFFVLSLGPVLHVNGRTDLLPGGREIPLPYAVLHRLVPFLKISRSVSRFDVMVMLSLSVLAAAGLAHVTRWLLSKRSERELSAASAVLRKGVAWSVGPLCAGLIVLEFCAAPYPLSPPDTPPWYETLRSEPGQGAVLNLPMNWDRPGYLLYQTVHQRPLTVAYISRNDPRTLVERCPVLQDLRYLGPDVIVHDLAAIAPSVLDYLDVQYVVLDAYKMPEGSEERRLTTEIAQEMLGSQLPVYRDDRLVVYQIDPPSDRQPFIMLGEGWGAREVGYGHPWRTIANESTILIHSPDERTLALGLEARAEGDSNLTFWLGDTVVGGVSVDDQASHYETGRFEVAEGDTSIRLQSSTRGGSILISSLELIPAPGTSTGQ